VWNKTVIDGYDVVSMNVSLEEGKAELTAPGDEWCSRHVQQSQCCLQIVKCN